MYMVVVLHVLGQGGILTAQPPFTTGYYFSWLLETACYCAVNCFGLISGYVSHTGKFSGERAFYVWAQAAFYSAGITLLFKLAAPESVSFRNLLTSLFPVITQKYWYFTAYFGLLFFIPFLSAFVQTLSTGGAKRLMVAIVLIFAVLPTLTDKDLFFTKAGYSLLWLCNLYLLGACIRKMDMGWGPSVKGCILGYFICVSVTTGSKALLSLGMARFGVGIIREDLLLSYTSPTILLSAVFLLLLCRRLSVSSAALAGIIHFFAPLSFGVYLIHTHPLIWNVLLAERFKVYASLAAPLCILSVLLTACGIFLACAVVDLARYQLFQHMVPLTSKLFHRGSSSLDKQPQD